MRTKRPNEGWADFAEELRHLTEKAFPGLDTKSIEQMALSQYLGRLNNPQVAFAIKQERPKNLEEAIRSTLEMESYLMKPATVASIGPDQDEFTVGTVGLTGGAAGHIPHPSEQTLMRTIDRLSQQMSQLEAGLTQWKVNSDDYARRPSYQPPPRRDQTSNVICYRVGRRDIMPGVVLCVAHQNRETRDPPCHRPGRGG